VKLEFYCEKNIIMIAWSQNIPGPCSKVFLKLQEIIIFNQNIPWWLVLKPLLYIGTIIILSDSMNSSKDEHGSLFLIRSQSIFERDT
jgi:hypothetical protein